MYVFLCFRVGFHEIQNIRAVGRQRSSPESRLGNKIKMHLTKKKKKKKKSSNSWEYEDVLYFDLQPHPKACALGAVVMEWKQTLFEIWMLSDDWLMWYKHFIKQTKNLCLWPWSQGQWGGVGMGMVRRKLLDQYLTSGKVPTRSS